MNNEKRKLAGLALISSLLICGRIAEGQSAYFQAVTNLNPVGYWPMHEVAAPAQGNIETNYGTLGLLGTGYYPDWAQNTGAFTRGNPGALAGDSDPSVFFTRATANATGSTNSLYVPNTSRLSTLNPPFSVECWVNGNTVAGRQGDIWSQNGFEGLNAGGSGGGAGAVHGIRLYWNAPGIIVYGYYNDSTLNNIFGAQTAVGGVWHHVVVTCDAGTNMSIYIDGSQSGSTKSAVGLYSPEYWTPFE